MKKTISVLAALAISVAVPALAEVGDTDTNDEETTTTTVAGDFDEETGILTWTITDEDGEDVTLEIQVVEPGEKVNHGKIVSAFVHALKAEGHKGIGQWVRDVAQSDLGKKDKDGSEDGDEDSEATSPNAGRGHGNGQGKNKDKGDD